MDVRQLSTLVAIADHGTFSAAARALYTVQSNVSAHISRLEKELGVSLVDRMHGGLTEDGARVVERARRVLNEMDDIAADMASRNEDVSGQTRLGVIGTTARWLMPQMLGRLGERHPGVRTVIQEGATSTLIPNVLSGHLNAAIIHLPVDDAELVIEPLFAEDLFLLTDSNHPLAANDTLHLSELDQFPLLLPPMGSALRKVLERAAANADITLRAQAEIDGVRLLASLAFDGYGAAIVPATAVPSWLKGSFRMISVPELPRRIVAFVRRRRPGPNAPTTATLEVLKALLAEHGHEQPGVYPGTSAIPIPKPD
jgi:LysR family hydrogen peroxide-inducible transcriptional activator